MLGVRVFKGLTLMSVISHERARVAALTRSRSADDPDLTDARQKLAAERLAAYIKRTLNAAPPLTDEQRSKLAAILRAPGEAR